MKRKIVVYKLSYLDCEKTYVGQTKILSNIRRNEHKNNILLNEEYHNVISKYSINTLNNDGSEHDFHLSE